MEKFVNRMIEEHAQLCTRIEKLQKFVYSEQSDSVNKVDFANMAIQLSAMKKYEECLRARLENSGIRITVNGEYAEVIAHVKECDHETDCPSND